MKCIGSAGCILVSLVIGCSGQPKAMLAGGKPVDHWLDELHNPEPKARKTAVTKLGNAATVHPVALSAVIGALNDPDAGVRCEAILALLKCGPGAREAIPALAEAQQKDSDAKVRTYATKALEQLKNDK
jgi:HEAT repeat protein